MFLGSGTIEIAFPSSLLHPGQRVCLECVTGVRASFRRCSPFCSVGAVAHDVSMRATSGVGHDPAPFPWSDASAACQFCASPKFWWRVYTPVMRSLCWKGQPLQRPIWLRSSFARSAGGTGVLLCELSEPFGAAGAVAVDVHQPRKGTSASIAQGFLWGSEG